MLQKKEVFILIIVGSGLFLLIAFFLLLFVSYFYRKKKNILLEKELLKKVFNENLLQSKLEIKEQTLQHISYELHDNLGQIASLVKINLNTISLQDPVMAGQKLRDTKDLMRQLIGDIKALSVSLGSDSAVRKGLVWALQFEKERIEKTGQFAVSFTGPDELLDINTDRAIILYRMAQEVLNNSIKHSKAKHIDIILKVSGKSITLALNDDGSGFDPESNRQGAGLFNLQHRAALIGARLKIDSSVGKGTAVSIEFNA
jgi:two-component system NarL family sensor kinase